MDFFKRFGALIVIGVIWATFVSSDDWRIKPGEVEYYQIYVVQNKQRHKFMADQFLGGSGETGLKMVTVGPEGSGLLYDYSLGLNPSELLALRSHLVPVGRDARKKALSERAEQYLIPLKELREEFGFDYNASGKVLEVLAFQMFQKIYPAPAFVIYSGVAYEDGIEFVETGGIKNNRIMGELDLVIFDAAGKAVLIAEVKMGGILRKADEAKAQLNRFTVFVANTVRRNIQFLITCPDKFNSDNDGG